MERPNYLFSKQDWFSVQEMKKGELSNEVSTIDGDRLLNTSSEDLCSYFEKKYTLDIPGLKEAEMFADQNETKVDISHDQRRMVFDRNRPFYIDGTEVKITVPFEGEKDAFYIKPTTFNFNPPIADVKNDHIVIRVIGAELSPEKVKSEINRTLGDIKNYLVNLKKDADKFNSEIRPLVHGYIERRKSKLLSNQSLVSSLGFPLKERKDAIKTYAPSAVKRKITPSFPKASTEAFKPEPALSKDDYNHIIEVIQNMAQVMERSPKAFSSLDEEALRSHFLVQLNGHYGVKRTFPPIDPFRGCTGICAKQDIVKECYEKYLTNLTPPKRRSTSNLALGDGSGQKPQSGIKLGLIGVFPTFPPIDPFRKRVIG